MCSTNVGVECLNQTTAAEGQGSRPQGMYPVPLALSDHSEECRPS